MSDKLSPVKLPFKVGEHVRVECAEAHILLVTLNRPLQLNAMTDHLEADLCSIFDWFEREPELWCAVITGSGRAFCAGQDLKDWLGKVERSGPSKQPEKVQILPLRIYVDSSHGTLQLLANSHGFASLARRRSSKPLVAAVNGACLGGGLELAVNCDVVVSFTGNKFAFPEVKRGVVAAVGGIPNALQRSPMLLPYVLTGDLIPQHLLDRHLLTSTAKTASEVLPEALSWARRIVTNSPDAVMASKEQANLHKEGLGVRDVVEQSLKSDMVRDLFSSANFQEGLRAFSEVSGGALNRASHH